MNLEPLAQQLNYAFQDMRFLQIALTHRSYQDENNERMEFLGDGVLNFIIAEALYQQFPTAQEGALSRFRATLINRTTLAELARRFDLGTYLFLGQGELKMGGRQRESILSCGMEAVIGAIYLDGGFEKLRTCLLRWYEPLLSNLSDAASHKDPKSQLQEHLQSHHGVLPVYQIDAVEGQRHQQIFVVSCSVPNTKKITIGRGSSRRRAEQEAAEAMLEKLKHE